VLSAIQLVLCLGSLWEIGLMKAVQWSPHILTMENKVGEKNKQIKRQEAAQEIPLTIRIYGQ